MRCSHHPLQVENVTATIIGTFCSTKHHSVIVSWQLRNNTMNLPTSFSVECRNDRHSIELLVNNETFSVELGGLFPSATDYVCCVEAVYGSYVANKVCTLLRFLNTTASTSGESDLVAGSDSDNTTSIVGGVFGFIVALLLVLLVICGGALLLLQRSKPLVNKR